MASAATIILTMSLLASDISVIDGDTVKLRSGEFAGTRVRIVGLDAPEIHGKCNAERRLAAKAKTRLIDLARTGRIRLEVSGRDKYGRILAVMTVNGRDVARTLIDERLARPYAGGHRPGWCK